MYVSVLDGGSVSFSSHGEVHTLLISLIVRLRDGLTRAKSASISWSRCATRSWYGGGFLICLGSEWLVMARRCCAVAICCRWGRRRCFRGCSSSWNSLRSILAHPVDIGHHSFFLHGFYIQRMLLHGFCMSALRPRRVTSKITGSARSWTRVGDLLVQPVSRWRSFSLPVKPLLLFELPKIRFS